MHAEIVESAEFRDVLSGLERFLVEVFQEIHPEWHREGLDGILPELARKNGDNEIEIVGLCIVLSDQTLAPLHLRLQLDPTENSVSWLECRLGQAMGDPARRVPYTTNHGRLPVLARLDSVDWAYHVGYGERRE